jgi:hypothetical protein
MGPRGGGSALHARGEENRVYFWVGGVGGVLGALI